MKANKILSLAGNWQFRTGTKADTPEDHFDGTVWLPGSLDENGVGPKDPGGTQWLTRKHAYVGSAVYQRTVTIPETWKDKHIELFLEQCHIRSQVWVDNVDVGHSQNSFTVPHVYDLSRHLTPGEHTLTIVVDNKEIFTTYISADNQPLMGNTTSRHTQTCWNGITGKIILRAFDKIRITRVRTFPKVKEKLVSLEVDVCNDTEHTAKGDISVYANSCNPDAEHRTERLASPQEFRTGKSTCIIDLPMGEKVQLWDEFHPNLYKLTLALKAQADGIDYADETTEAFGMRSFVAEGTQFSVNGKKTFLRGTEDAAAYPLTGHPPMDIDAWLTIYRTCKAYGMNHIRFHSWCPPKAAFEAADRVGMYLQPEGPTGGKITMPVPEGDYVTHEMMRIQDAFGNHPSFVMMSIGNELNTSFEAAGIVIQRLKKNDPRQLHASGSNPMWNRMEGGSVLPDIEDFFVAMNTDGYDGSKGGYAKGPLRGAFHMPNAGHLENAPPSTDTDYSDSIAHINIPALGHEVGQHAMYPNYAERSKYTGVLTPENFDAFYAMLRKAGMGDLAHKFFLSSGKWATLLYKEEIEASLRTKGYGGFRLLDLHDYPGQDTALVGVLDVFYESKGLIEVEEWCRFCSPVVPLIRMKKLTWTNDETLEASVQVANYDKSPIRGTVTWQLSDGETKVLASGEVATLDIPQGDLTTVGKLSIPLDKLPAPSRLVLECGIAGTSHRNNWDIWVYPRSVDGTIPDGVKVVSTWGDAKQSLAKGDRVLLLSRELGRSVPGSQAALFWSYGYFKQFEPAGTLGVLCDPEHPALAEFPTDFHQNWQWADILKRSCALVLDFTPADYRPVVQVVDNKFRHHKLGSLFEARVGEGRLMVCSMDISSDLERRPVARQMRHSILAYMRSDRFDPEQALEIAVLDKGWRISE